MRQLHVTEPGYFLGHDSQQEVLYDLIARIQVLESRLRELEETVSEVSEKETVAVGR
ncbi:MAG: hypothetical protein ACRDJ4_11565 [Actinomycetota bacterium]